MIPRTAILITSGYTLLGPDDIRATPDNTYGGGPAGLAERVGKLFRGEGVVLVDAEVAARLGMSDTWQTIALQNGPRVYLGRLDTQDHPLIVPEWKADTVAGFELFHRLVGVAFHRSPGVTGLNLLQHLHPKGRTKPIVWKTDGPVDAYEAQYFLDDWRRVEDVPSAFVHGYDRRRSGLAAMNVVQVARYALRHQRKRTYDPRYAGWWLVEIPPWNHPGMPNPAGYCHHDRPANHACIRWVTSPTIDLLNELAQQGMSEGVRFVHDSWIGERSRLFEDWANVLEGAHNRAEAAMSARDGEGVPVAEAMDAERVRDAVKAVYRETAGMFANPDAGWIQRDDWYAAKVAVERSNAWRSVWNAVRRQREPVWPVRVDGDKWWFPSDAEDGAAAAPGGLTLGPRQGQWRHDGTVGRS